MEWFGDTASPVLFAQAAQRLEALGGARVEIDFTPFRDAARLLYEGPWVAERWLAVREFHARKADMLLPVTRQIIEQGARYSAADAFAALHRLRDLRRAVDSAWMRMEALALPTAAFIPTRSEVEADPIGLNSKLGAYTNFTNLLDCAALAVPAGFRPNGLPFGISLIGPAWSDARLAAIGAAFHRAAAPKLGATEFSLPEKGRVSDMGPALSGSPIGDPIASIPLFIPLAVVGAHLRGQPLNHQLTERGGRFLRADRTAGCYRLHALAGTVPPKPGLTRVGSGEGGSIEVEIWELPAAAWADLVAAIPPPLGIGALLLADGSAVKGFLCESVALAGAEDITRHGGWRAYLAARA
jgi:allophanate hydrolase